MIRLVCFDLDGVLADSRELHYQALNAALAEVDEKYVINREEHLARFDARTTSSKLKMLSEERGLPQELHTQIWKRKQQLTLDVIPTVIHPNEHLVALFLRLRRDGNKVGVCSNAVGDTVRFILHRLEVLHLVDYIYSNDNVVSHKPHGEIYMRCMVAAGVNATETLIVEDSHIGRTAALNSGAHLCAVTGPAEVTESRVYQHINQINAAAHPRPKWKGGNMNVLIPMAGAGSRFAAAGYTFPKPLIETIDGKPMIQLVVENLNIEGHYIFIVQKEHYEKYNLKQMLNLIAPGCDIVQVEGVTEGAACTTLLAKDFISNGDALLIANSDQYLEWDSNEFMYSMTSSGVSGGIVTFEATHPKWSFARLDTDGYVIEVAEKNPISTHATAGVYYWRWGIAYVECAEEMIRQNIRVNNEFYVCPVYNQYILNPKVSTPGKIKNFPIKKVWGLGTPEDLQVFLQRNK